MKYSHLSFLLLVIAFSSKTYAIDNVNSQALSELTILQHYQFPASVVALNEVTLSSEITGIVRSDTLRIGSIFKKNQTIIRIDCTDNVLAKEQGLAALKRLQVQKELAQQQLKRARQLVRVKSISKQELDQKQTTLDADIASIEQQHVALKIIDHNNSKCRIKAPFTGIVTEFKTPKGSYVTPGLPLLTLMNPKAVEIEASLPFALVSKLTSIKNISFKQNNKSNPISIRALLPNINPTTNQQKLRLSINNSQPLPNSIGLITWNSNQTYIPSEYIVQRDGQLGLFINNDGKAKFYPLKDAVEGQNSLVYLSPNTLIVTNNLLIINNNDNLN